MSKMIQFMYSLCIEAVNAVKSATQKKDSLTFTHNCAAKYGCLYFVFPGPALSKHKIKL